MKTPAARSAPMILDDLTQGVGGRAIDHELNVMRRRIGTLISIDPSRIVGNMIRRIPTTIGDVEPAGKCQRIVHHDDFLMMRRAQGMAAVEKKMNSSVGSPGMSIERHDLPIRRVNHREIPEQNVNVELAVAAYQLMQEISKGR